MQRRRAMRVLRGVERTIGALVELQGRPKRRRGGQRIGEAKVRSVEGEIQRLLRSVGQVEPIADALRRVQATSR
jgi:hypothetical protein